MKECRSVVLALSIFFNIVLAIVLAFVREGEEVKTFSERADRAKSNPKQRYEERHHLVSPATNRDTKPNSRSRSNLFLHFEAEALPSKRCKDWIKGSKFLWATSTAGTGTDKASNTHGKHAYEVLYEKYFQLFYCTAEYALKPKIKLFEIGIGPGGFMTSFRMYERLFGEERLEYYALEYQDQREIISKHHELSTRQKQIALQRLKIGDQSNLRDLANVTIEWGPFDVIVDDGSHVCWHQIKSFKYLFLNTLAPGGVYFIEDLQTNFHKRWNGSKKDQMKGETAVEMINDLMQFLHFHWWAHPDFREKNVRFETERSDINTYGQEIAHFAHYEPEIMDWIATIDCDREVCAIRKRMTKLEHRNYAGNVRM